MAETIAPAPPGVQAPSTYVPPDPPQEPLKVKVGEKGRWKAEFDKLTKDETSTTKQDTNKTEEVSVKEPVKSDVKTEEKAPEKPASPLDAVLAKTQKEPEKTEEPDVLKEFDEVNKPTPTHWDKARGLMRKQSHDVQTLQARLDELAKAPKYDSNVVEALTKERDEIKAAYERQEQNLKAINAEYSDEFQVLLKQKEGIVGKISSRVKAYGGDANALVEALSLPEGKVKTAQIKEALSELDPDDKPRIHALIETLEAHDEKIADFKKDLPKKWDEIQARRESQLAEQSQVAIKTLEKEFGRVSETLPAKYVTLREAGDDFPDWNKDIRDSVEGGLGVLKPNGANFDDSAEVAILGRHYPKLEKRYLALYSENVELRKANAELTGAGPDFKGGGKPTTKVEKKPGVKYHEALAQFQGAGLGEV